ncbi:type II secretion system F family protein [Candidatus Parcubacteria bacterium]|jgi:type IV pilus assembly protein PilC|nr:MAG: type II secretion system F family protein [Candidatus Parcubacteria bacterium]
MAIFDYRAKNLAGQTVEGAVVAPTDGVAYDTLREKQLTIISLKERPKTAKFLGTNLFSRVSIKEQVIFARQLAVMIAANVPIVRALRILVRQTKNVHFKMILSDVLDEVDGGAKLSTAMARYPQVFNTFFVSMVRSGETTGKLDEVLVYLADQKEKDYGIISRVRGAFIYPAVVLFAVVAVGVVMVIFVLPKLLTIFAEGGAELPVTTKMLIAVSDFVRNQWYVVVLIVAAAVGAFMWWRRTENGRRVLDILKLRTPIAGKIFTMIYLTRLSRSLSTLLGSGVPISQALAITGEVVGNHTYQAIIQRTIQEVEDGNSITTVFVKSKQVPLMLSQMMAVGEQSGRLDQVLLKVAQFYENELDGLIRNLVSLIEPLILLLMGVGVGFMVSSILLPIYNVSNAIQ